jgi:hypothetical protein
MRARECRRQNECRGEMAGLHRITPGFAEWTAHDCIERPLTPHAVIWVALCWRQWLCHGIAGLHRRQLRRGDANLADPSRFIFWPERGQRRSRHRRSCPRVTPRSVLVCLLDARNPSSEVGRASDRIHRKAASRTHPEDELLELRRVHLAPKDVSRLNSTASGAMTAQSSAPTPPKVLAAIARRGRRGRSKTGACSPPTRIHASSRKNWRRSSTHGAGVSIARYSSSRRTHMESPYSGTCGTITNTRSTASTIARRSISTRRR